MVSIGSASGFVLLKNQVDDIDQGITGIEKLVKDINREELTEDIDTWGVRDPGWTSITIDTKYQIIPDMEFYFTLNERSLVLILFLLSIEIDEQISAQDIIVEAHVTGDYTGARESVRVRKVYGGQLITGYEYRVMLPGDYDSSLSIKTSRDPVNITIFQRKFSIIAFKKTSET
jgi:hypothetical protein